MWENHVSLPSLGYQIYPAIRRKKKFNKTHKIIYATKFARELEKLYWQGFPQNLRILFINIRFPNFNLYTAKETCQKN